MIYELITKSIRVNGRPKLIIDALRQSVFSLEIAINDRNQFIDKFSNGEIASDQLPILYLGIETAEGRDMSFPTIIRQIKQYTDDCLWFGHRLGLDLVEYGTLLRTSENHDRIAINQVSFAGDADMLPKDKRYKSWLSTAVHLKTTRPRKWRRKLNQALAARAIGTKIVDTERQAELLRRYRSTRPLRREMLLAGTAVATFLLAYFDLTPYPSTNLVGLGGGLVIGAIVSYTVRLSRR